MKDYAQKERMKFLEVEMLKTPLTDKQVKKRYQSEGWFSRIIRFYTQVLK